MSWIQLAIALLNRRKKKEIKLNLDMIVFHEQLSVLFLQHCTSELCAENYLFYKEAKKWKSESTKVSVHTTCFAFVRINIFSWNIAVHLCFINK